MSRKTCLSCTLKHLGQAVVLLGEAEKGYPMHKYIAIGHMAEAEDECVEKYPELANEIRAVRLLTDEGKDDMTGGVLELIEKVHDKREANGDGCGLC